MWGIWYNVGMIDFPITTLFDDSICMLCLEWHLHPRWPRIPSLGALVAVGGPSPRLFPYLPLPRLLGRLYPSDGHGVHANPATSGGLVLRRCGMTTGEPPARLARKPLYALRHRLQPNLNATVPAAMRAGTACEADWMAAERSTATPVKG